MTLIYGDGRYVRQELLDELGEIEWRVDRVRNLYARSFDTDPVRVRAERIRDKLSELLDREKV